MEGKCRKIMAWLLIAVFAATAFAGCGTDLPTASDTPPTGNFIQTEADDSEPERFVMSDIDVMENRTDELVFSASIANYINAYNSLYREDKGDNYLTSPEKWQCTEYDKAIHSPHATLYYYFTEDERAFSLPTISVYVPPNGDYIQEITVNFDDHSYAPEMYELFEEMCFYTLQAFFPELSSEQITELYKEANEIGNSYAFVNREWYDSDMVPCVLYHKDGIGVYPYFAIGQWQHLCIIPVTEETIADFAAKGTEIREIK